MIGCNLRLFQQAAMAAEDLFLAICRDAAADHYLQLLQRKFEIESLVCNLSGEFLKIRVLPNIDVFRYT